MSVLEATAEQEAAGTDRSVVDSSFFARTGYYVLLTLAVVLPLTRRGWLLLLDWVPGPHAHLPRAFWGLDGSLLASYPFGLTVLFLGKIVGAATMGWVPLAAILLTGAVGMDRLVGGPWVRRVAAATLYVVNPVIFDRTFVGQFAFLAAYAALPYVVASMRKAATATRWSRRLRPALWVAVLIGLAPHFAWVAMIVFAGILLSRPSMRTALWLVSIGAATVVTSSYLLVSSVGAQESVSVGGSDLSVFRTTGDHLLGLFGNVLGLYGFWRQEPVPPKHYIPGWFILLASLLLVCGVGAWALVRRGERFLVCVAVVTGPCCYLLALGEQGPTGPIFRLIFLHVPGFAIMREPQKFIVGVALVYALLFGFGVEQLVSNANGKARVLTACACALLVLAYTPTEFWALGGQVHVSHYPQAWERVDEQIGKGSGKVLFLPWHQYMAQPFTGHIVYNPGKVVFRRDVITGDNVELGGLTSSTVTRSAYIGFLLAHGPELTTFGQLVTPLDVEYVFVAKAVDWPNYSWLDHQSDLRKVDETDDHILYRNLRRVGSGWRTQYLVKVQDWGEVVGLSEKHDLTGVAVEAEKTAGGAIRPPTPEPQLPEPAATPTPSVTQPSPVTYKVDPGPGGYVVVAEPSDPSWRLGATTPIDLAAGTMAFPIGTARATVRFHHWLAVQTGLTLSVASFLILLVLTLLPERVLERTRRTRA